MSINKPMNYKLIYDNLIKRSRERTLVGYTEKHHIIPRCMGGTDHKDNFAILTAEEHYLAHQLLVKIYPNNGKLIFAARMMTKSNKNQLRNNKEYGWLKRKYAAYLSEYRKGKYFPSKPYHRIDPYIFSIQLVPILDLLDSYRNCNLWKSADYIIESSNIFHNFPERW